MDQAIKEQLKSYLANRQITKQEFPSILHPEDIKLSTYHDFLHGEEWVSTLGTNLLHQTEIFIIGDYDADGVLSATVANQALRTVLKSSYNDKIHVLERTRLGGYGLHKSDLDNINDYMVSNHKTNATLIILDNGVGTYPEYDHLNKLAQQSNIKYTVLVADHHEQNNYENYPEHYQKMFGQQPLVDPIIVDPFLNDERQGVYQGLSATGLAYVLMMGLVDWMINFKKSHGMADTSVNMPQEMKDLLKTYAGISIVTDSCEMLGENRNYVDFAIKYLNRYVDKLDDKTNPLITFCYDLNQEHEIKEFDEQFFGWTLGPTINAVSRMSSSCKVAQDLFNTDNVDDRHEYIQMAIEFNNKRKSTVNKLSNELISQLSAKDNLNNSIIINLADYLPDVDWNEYPGLIGLIANNVMTAFQTSTLLLAPNRKNTGLTGSARTPEFARLFHAMFVVKDKLKKLEFGGHREAFGVSFLNFDELDKFRDEVNYVLDHPEEEDNSYKKNYDDSGFIRPRYDFEFANYSDELNDYLMQFSPFGQNFEAPLIHVQLPLSSLNINYLKDRHAKILYSDHQFLDWNSALTWQRMINQHPDSTVDIYATPELNEWNGNVEVQFIIDHIHLNQAPNITMSDEAFNNEEFPF